MCMNVTTAVQPKQLLRTVEISKYHILLMYWAGPKTSLGRKGGGEEGKGKMGTTDEDSPGGAAG